MSTPGRIFLNLALVALLMFSIFGFVAATEPLDRSIQVTWRFIYGTLGAAALSGLVRTNRHREKR